MSELTVVRRNVDIYDTLEINTTNRLEFESGELTAVYPADAETTEYVVASVGIKEGNINMPSGSAILELRNDSVLCLIPREAY